MKRLIRDRVRVGIQVVEKGAKKEKMKALKEGVKKGSGVKEKMRKESRRRRTRRRNSNKICNKDRFNNRLILYYMILYRII